jgi:2-polyprenyl-3-methyl-5-hydroxy-6-metoxy-1,4-benzoquinol methylase|tara:strand:- start:153 stop:1061 length:909 start_codon:yes stop_codon:yes gene_type:complete
MKNPILDELIKLKLISKSNLMTLSNKTRDKKIKVIKDLKTKIIFLEKYITTNDYYSSLKYKDDDRKVSDKSTRKIANIKTFSGNIKTPIIEDDYRRVNQFEKNLKNKDILDFGCGWGGFLRNIKNYKSLSGVELREECINFIKNNIKKIDVSDNINSFDKKFDIITMFHVLEHIPYQIETLKVLKSKLKNKGKIIIEVPHAEDFLILQKELKEFKNFTFWSEHLVLHTFKSLKSILLKSGFKNVNIQYYQRYNFSNHLGWFLKRKPGGHNFYKEIVSDKLNLSYCENLKKLGQTDTLIAIAD